MQNNRKKRKPKSAIVTNLMPNRPKKKREKLKKKLKSRRPTPLLLLPNSTTPMPRTVHPLTRRAKSARKRKNAKVARIQTIKLHPAARVSRKDAAAA